MFTDWLRDQYFKRRSAEYDGAPVGIFWDLFDYLHQDGRYPSKVLVLEAFNSWRELRTEYKTLFEELET